MSETNADLLCRAGQQMRNEARAYLPGGKDESTLIAFAALLEAVADDDPEDPLHDPACRTCTAALTAARTYLGESR